MRWEGEEKGEVEIALSMRFTLSIPEHLVLQFKIGREGFEVEVLEVIIH